MSVAGVNFSGLATGIDSDSIIQATLKVERAPEAIWKNQITNYKTQQAAYNAVSAQLLTFQIASQAVDGLRSFDLVTATSSATDVATVTAATGAQPGSHTIDVTHLAKAEKIAATAQPSATSPLGFTGQIVINGKAVNVAAGDSLQVLAGNINSAGSGVSASIISPSPNQFILTLASKNSGVQGKLSLSDSSGGAFLSGTLGLFGAGTSVRHVLNGTDAGSDLFADSATSVATLEGLTAIPPAQGTVSITSGGTTKSVLVDLSKSLGGIAADVNAAFGSAVATIATVTDPISGASRQQLQLSGVSGAGSLVDDNNVLANLGLVQRDYGATTQLQAGQDATFKIDGITGSRPTNSLTDVISGVTISLLKEGTVATPATSTLDVGSDTATIKSNITAFVKSFNATIDLIAKYSVYDPTTGKTGALFGDSTTENILDSLVTKVTGQVAGLPSKLSVISQVGITLDQTNQLNINDAALSTALSNDLQGVGKLFRAAGQPTDAAVQFVSGSGDTRPSGGTGYAVVISQPAKQAVVTAGAALLGALGQDETLSFTGNLFGTLPSATGGYQINLRAGSSLNDIVSQINADGKLGPIVSASNVGNKLTLTSKSYGAFADLAIISTIGGATANSTGIGTTLIDAKGLDVAGTINGEPAAGAGQFLTGFQSGGSGLPKGRALGLQIRITATTAGSYGSITYTSGVGDAIKNFIATQTDGFTGALTTGVKGFQSAIDDTQSNIDGLEDRLKAVESGLRSQYASLESTVSQIKSTSASIGQIGR